MTTSGHLSAYDLILTVRSPLHIGSGDICTKTEYLFDPQTEMVSMIDPDALFDLLYRRHLVDRYESFVLSGNTHMDRFFQNHGILEPEQDGLFLYQVHAADALDDRHSLKEIRPFVRDPQHRAYVPGSSIKGALRTALLTGWMEKEKRGSWPTETRKDKKARQMQELEGQYLNTLYLKRDRNGNIANDPINSIMRGLFVSDSAPISDADLILVGKIDANEKGEYHSISLCRECVRPGTELRLQLTLDYSVLPNTFTVDTILQQINAFDTFYQKTYLSRFTPPPGASAISYRNALILGGGSGFFSKTLAYPYLGLEKGMGYTERFLCGQFSGHHHEDDRSRHGISPHTMKYGKYQGKLWPYGVCEVQIR